MVDIDGTSLGLLMVIGSDPEIGVRSACNAEVFLPGRWSANELIEAAKDDSKMDDMDGV